MNCGKNAELFQKVLALHSLMCMFVCLGVYEAEFVQCMLVYHVNMCVVLCVLLLYCMCAFEFLYAHIAKGFDKT